jgi:hypothetical protein
MARRRHLRRIRLRDGQSRAIRGNPEARSPGRGLRRKGQVGRAHGRELRRSDRDREHRQGRRLRQARPAPLPKFTTQLGELLEGEKLGGPSAGPSRVCATPSPGSSASSPRPRCPTRSSPCPTLPRRISRSAPTSTPASPLRSPVCAGAPSARPNHEDLGALGVQFASFGGYLITVAKQITLKKESRKNALTSIEVAGFVHDSPTGSHHYEM